MAIQLAETNTSLADRDRSRSSRAPAALVFAGAVALVLMYALRGGGSYDLVAFEENGLVVWWLLAVGLAFGLLPRARASRGALLMMAALAGYAAWTALSLTWTDSYELTFKEVARVLAYLGLIALICSTVDRQTWRAAAAGLGIGAFLVCAVAVGSRLAPALFGRDHVDALLHINRLSVPFGYWNAVAAWGAMATALGLSWSAHDHSRVQRAVALAFVPVAALTTYLTYSRAGVAGTALAVLAVLAMSRNRITVIIHAAVAALGIGLSIAAVRAASEIAQGTGTRGASTVLGVLVLASAACVVTAVLTNVAGVDRWRVPLRVGRPLAAGAAVICVVCAVVFGPSVVSKVWESFTRVQPTQTSANPTTRLTSLSGTRYPLWKVVLKAFDAHPLDGIGAGTTEFWWNEHATNDEFVRDAHSIWLQNLEELGAPGLLLIVAVAGSALGLGIAVRRRVRRTASAGAAAAFVAAFLVYLLHASVDWMWESTAVTALALAGIAVLGTRLGGASRTRLGGASVRLRAPARLVLVLIALAAGVVQLPGLLSTAAIRHSQAAESARQANVALGWAQNAVDAEPWSASAYEQLGLVLESAGQLPAASRDLQRAISREPQNYEHWLVLARIETELGRLGQAVRDYDRARQLRPRASIFNPVSSASTHR